MQKKRIIIATIRPWNIKNAIEFKKRNYKRYDTLIIDSRKDLRLSLINSYAPKFVFFPHWSWVIPEDIHRNFECILFHMTDLPFGRGGSPLQNLIIKGFNQTKISAIRVTGGLDTGPIYLKRPLSLKGRAQEIYENASKIIFNYMIPTIIRENLTPSAQKGRVVTFKRRSLAESRIPKDIEFNSVYDFIRMLDADGYPAAFVETRNLVFEFRKAHKKKNGVEVCANIIRKDAGYAGQNLGNSSASR